MTFLSGLQLRGFSAWGLLLAGILLFALNIFCGIIAAGSAFTQGVLVTHISAGDINQSVHLPFSDSSPTGIYRYTLRVDFKQNPLFSGRLHITPDDCVTAITVNGADVPLAIARGGLCDFVKGFIIDLGLWLRSGDNTLVIDFRNKNGPAGLAVQYDVPFLWQEALFALSLLLISAGLVRARLLELDTLLMGIFVCVLVYRFLYPFYFNPMDELWSDPQRHWDNGRVLFDPHRIWSGADPKTYQVWIYLLRKLAVNNNRSIVALVTGLLCAAMPYFWYRALREFCTRRMALACAILLGAHLSFVVIYSYFMIETIVLTSTALAMWMTFRSVRKKTLSSCIVATLCCLVAAFSKQVIVPVMGIAIAYLLLCQPRKLTALCWMVGLCLLFALPAAWETYTATRGFSPFGFTGWLNVYRNSGHTKFAIDQFDSDNQEGWRYEFSSPSFYINPLTPLGSYTSYRLNTTYFVSVDLANGMKDWNQIIREAALQHDFRERLMDIYENAIYFFFGPSWPDTDTNPGRMLHFLNFHLRWTFIPCITVILALTPFVRMERPKMFITCIAFVMILLMLFQQVGVMEGRYRKPIEPFILLGALFIIESFFCRCQQGAVSLKEFIIGFLKGPWSKPPATPHDLCDNFSKAT